MSLPTPFVSGLVAGPNAAELLLPALEDLSDATASGEAVALLPDRIAAFVTVDLEQVRARCHQPSLLPVGSSSQAVTGGAKESPINPAATAVVATNRLGLPCAAVCSEAATRAWVELFQIVR
jgi:hypothetical protein